MPFSISIIAFLCSCARDPYTEHSSFSLSYLNKLISKDEDCIHFLLDCMSSCSCIHLCICMQYAHIENVFDAVVVMPVRPCALYCIQFIHCMLFLTPASIIHRHAFHIQSQIMNAFAILLCNTQHAYLA